MALNNQEMKNQIYSLIYFKDLDSILDVGCGGGYDLFEIGEKMKIPY